MAPWGQPAGGYPGTCVKLEQTRTNPSGKQTRAWKAVLLSAALLAFPETENVGFENVAEEKEEPGGRSLWSNSNPWVRGAHEV